MPFLSMLLLLALPLSAYSKTLEEKSYKEHLAIQYANLAGASYCEADSLLSWSCGEKCLEGVTETKLCQGKMSSAFVGKFNGKCFASFKGLSGLSSVVVDMMSFSLPWGCPDCEVHQGFLAEWRALDTCMKHSLVSIGCGPEQALYGTGHDIGGAVVAIAMMDLKSAGWDIAEVFTFGMPRIGNAALANRFEDIFFLKFFRVTHGRDPFIHLPLRSVFYKHIEPEVFYQSMLFEQHGYVVCTDASSGGCSAQYDKDHPAVTSIVDRAFHDNYMGVKTSAAGCQSRDESCHAGIPGSWCAYSNPCDSDYGEHVYCDYGPWFAFGSGTCHCSGGFCPTFGVCQPRHLNNEVRPNFNEMRPTTGLQEMQELQPLAQALPVLMSLLCVAAGLLLALVVFRRARGIGGRADLHWGLLLAVESNSV